MKVASRCIQLHDTSFMSKLEEEGQWSIGIHRGYPPVLQTWQFEIHHLQLIFQLKPGDFPLPSMHHHPRLDSCRTFKTKTSKQDHWFCKSYSHIANVSHIVISPMYDIRWYMYMCFCMWTYILSIYIYIPSFHGHQGVSSRVAPSFSTLPHPCTATFYSCQPLLAEASHLEST